MILPNCVHNNDKKIDMNNDNSRKNMIIISPVTICIVHYETSRK